MTTLTPKQRAEESDADPSLQVNEQVFSSLDNDDEISLQNDFDAPNDIEYFNTNFAGTKPAAPNVHDFEFTEAESAGVGKASSPLHPDDEFDSLEALLSESVKLQSDAQRYKDQRRSLSKSWLTPEERRAIEASVHSYELRREWFPKANTVMFTVQRCVSCSSLHHHFIGYFQRQEHRTKLASRWVKADMTLIDTLPRERKENFEEVSTCIACCLNSQWGAAS